MNHIITKVKEHVSTKARLTRYSNRHKKHRKATSRPNEILEQVSNHIITYPSIHKVYIEVRPPSTRRERGTRHVQPVTKPNRIISYQNKSQDASIRPPQTNHIQSGQEISYHIINRRGRRGLITPPQIVSCHWCLNDTPMVPP